MATLYIITKLFHPRFRARLKNPAVPGLLGALLSLLITAVPTLLSGPVQIAIVVVAGTLVLWALRATFQYQEREERRERLNLSYRGIQLSHELYNLIRPFVEKLVSEPHARDELANLARTAYDRYFLEYRFRPLHFIDEVADRQLLVGSRARSDLESARNVAVSLANGSPITIQQIEELAGALNGVSDDLEHERPD